MSVLSISALYLLEDFRSGRLRRQEPTITGWFAAVKRSSLASSGATSPNRFGQGCKVVCDSKSTCRQFGTPGTRMNARPLFATIFGQNISRCRQSHKVVAKLEFERRQGIDKPVEYVERSLAVRLFRLCWSFPVRSATSFDRKLTPIRDNHRSARKNHAN